MRDQTRADCSRWCAAQCNPRFVPSSRCNAMVAPGLRLPEDLKQPLAEASALTGLTRAELIRQALAEYMQRRRRERLISEYVREALIIIPAGRDWQGEQGMRLLSDGMNGANGGAGSHAPAWEHWQTLQRPGRTESATAPQTGGAGAPATHSPAYAWERGGQPRTLYRSRIGDRPLTALTAAQMHAVKEGLRVLLGVVRIHVATLRASCGAGNREVGIVHLEYPDAEQRDSADDGHS